MKKKLMLVLTGILVAAGVMGTAPGVLAEETKSYPMYDPQVITSTGYVYGPSIRVNQFSGCISGCSMISPLVDIEKVVGGFTQEERNKGGEPIFYVADHYDMSEERKLIDKKVEELRGRVVCALDMQLYKYNGTENIHIEEVDQPLEIIIGIPSEANYVKLWDIQDTWKVEETREFAMLRVHNGKVDVLKDLDKDVKTLTFKTDKFSIYAMIYVPTGNIDAYLEGQTGAEVQNTSSAAQNDELDKVPKTGYGWKEDLITSGMGRRR